MEVVNYARIGMEIYSKMEKQGWIPGFPDHSFHQIDTQDSMTALRIALAEAITNEQQRIGWPVIAPEQDRVSRRHIVHSTSLPGLNVRPDFSSHSRRPRAPWLNGR